MTKPLLDSDKIGYKIVYKSADQYIITLKLENYKTPSNLYKTNENRNNIINPVYAKFRCNRAFVIDICHKFTDEVIDSIKSDYDSSFIYISGKYVIVDDYDDDHNKIYSRGIHYYVAYKAAFLHNLTKIENGLFETWYDNGMLKTKCNYVNGQMHGSCESWNYYGNLFEKYNYVNGEKNGPYYQYHNNGRIACTCNYINNKADGPCESWHENGQMDNKYNFLNGIINGLYESWDIDGNLCETYNFLNGICIDDSENTKSIDDNISLSNNEEQLGSKNNESLSESLNENIENIARRRFYKRSFYKRSFDKRSFDVESIDKNSLSKNSLEYEIVDKHDYENFSQ